MYGMRNSAALNVNNFSSLSSLPILLWLIKSYVQMCEGDLFSIMHSE